MNVRQVSSYVMALVLIGFLVALIVPAIYPARTDTGRPFIHTKVELTGIATALKMFESQFNKLPSGKNSEMFCALMGANPNQIRFFVAAKTNKIGEPLDSWGSPYRIQVLDQTNFIARSAGKNRVFGDKDDFIFDRLKNDFVKP